MYLLGHIGIVLFINFLIYRIFYHKNSENKIVLAIGAMLPDLIDKPIGSLFFNKGRWIGHSILVLTTLALVSYIIIKQTKYNSNAYWSLIIYMGSLAHLVLDMPGLTSNVLYWPFHGSIPEGNKDDFLHGFESLKTVVGEVVGSIFLIIIGIRENSDRKYWLTLLILAITYFLLFGIFYTILVVLG